MTSFRPARYTRLTLWILASPLIVMTLGGLLSESSEARALHNIAYASVAALKSSIGDPRNLEFEAVRITDAGAACIQYRARDANGSASRAQAVVQGSEVARSSGGDERFTREWNRQCLGLAHDVTRAVDRFF